MVIYINTAKWIITSRIKKTDTTENTKQKFKMETYLTYFASMRSEKAREFQKNIYFYFIDYAKVFNYVDKNKLWKILKEMGILDHLTCPLGNLYGGQEATARTGHGTTDWF